MSSGLVNVEDGSWSKVRRNFQRIKSNILGPNATPTFAGLTLTGLTASRLMASDANKALSSVADLTSWIAGVADEINVTDDGDGTVTIGIVNPLIVAKGGTGAASLTDHGLLVGSGTGAVTALGVAANGKIPIGSAGADPVLAEITGTANQITSTPGAGSITLSTPQDIHTGASPTFAGLTIVNAINEFSTDGTMGGDSDSAVPTEKATKLYTDTLRSDLASVANAKGASLIGIEDSLSLYTAVNVEAALAEVKDAITVVTTTANSIITVTGTLDSGNVASTQTINDADTYDVSEVSGTPGFDIQATMTGIVSGHEPNLIEGHYSYDGNHTVRIEMWNYTGTPAWDLISDTIITNTGGALSFFSLPITGTTTDYVSGGESKVRFNHAVSGNINHDFAIDYLAIKDDHGIGTGITDHGSLSGLSEDDHQQYIKDAEFTQDSGILVGTGSGTFTEETGATLRTSIGVGTGDSPQFTAVSIGNADTTITRVSAGVIAVEGTTVMLVGDAPAAHIIVSHSDTTGTGAELNTLTGGGDVGALHTHAAAYQPLDAELTSLAALSYVAASFVKMTGANTFALRTIAETADDLEGTIDHDQLANYDANKHIDHTGVTLTAGTGLTGGGDISAGRTFAVDGVLEDLDTLGAAVSDGQFIVATGAGTFAYEATTTARTSLGVGEADVPFFGGIQLRTAGLTKAVYSSSGAIGVGRALFQMFRGDADGSNANGWDFGYNLDLSSENFIIRELTYNGGLVANTRLTLAKGSGNMTLAGTLTVSSIAAEGSDVDKFLVDSSSVVKYRTGTQVLSDIGAAASVHTHDGDTLQLDGINSNGGAFAFNTTGAVTFNQTVNATFAGNITGNVTGNTSGSSGSCTGLSATATALATARNIGGVSFDGTAAIVPTTIVVADTTDTSCYVGLWESATGSLLPKTDAAITYNAGTGALTATTFIGALTGQADTVATITGLAPDTATTQATQAGITTCANLTTIGTIGTGTWQATDVGIGYGGTGQSTAQAAIDALSAVSGATNEHVLTKDTGSGNAIWKAAVGGGVAAHAILDGSVHTDSVADGVTRGSLIYGNATPNWDELVVGGDNTFLSSDGTDVSWKSLGVWTTPGFNAADFTANGAMTWTVEAGDVITYAYIIIGKTMYVNYYISLTTVGGTLNNALQIAIPASKVSANNNVTLGVTRDNGGPNTTSLVIIGAGTTVISVYHQVPAVNWSAATNTTSVFGSVVFEIQ